jgi:tetratricopeptide (TPR) repeat protein
MEIDLKKVADLESSRDYAAAIRALQTMLEQNPDASIRLRLAMMLLKTGQVDAALEHFQLCSQGDQVNHVVTLNYGHSLKAKGESNLAAEKYIQLGHMGDDKISAIGYWSLANLKSYEFQPEDVNDITRRLKNEATPPGYRGLLLLSLAEAKDQQGNTEAAFSALQQGNDIIAQHRPFRGDLYQQFIQALMRNFKPSNRPHSSDQDTPIFIIGMPRSGSTLVEQILANHSQVESTDELLLLGDISIALENKGSYAKGLNHLSTNKANAYASEYFAKTAIYRPAASPYFIDKNPNNFLHIGLIKTLFPQAKIVNIVRDPLDNGVSVFRQFFSEGHEYSYSFEGIIFYWQGYIALMQHWQNLFPDTIYNMSYERLAKEPQLSIQSLLDYCQLDSEPACFTPESSSRAVLTPSATQVRKPISVSAIGSGLKYKNHLKAHLPKLALIRKKSEEIFSLSQ